MTDNALLPCPFCGGKAQLTSVARDWYRIAADHTENCLLEDQQFDCPQTDDQLPLLLRDWNARTSLPPLIQTLHNNGDLIAAQAAIAQQAQMIEHLRGGPTPGFTAVDMTTAAADGFRDGVASKSEPCDGCFMAEAESLRQDAERYRWLNRQRRSVWRELGAAPMNMTGELIDAAMSKETI
jgi:hypothetical protein